MSSFKRECLRMLPGPTNVPLRVLQALSKPVIGHRGPEFHELYKRIIENVKYVFQTENDVFVLTCSGTGGVECAVSNIVGDGDKVIIPVQGVFSDRLRIAIERYGGVPVPIEINWRKGIVAEQVKTALDENPDAKAVAIVYNETSTGVTNRCLEEVGKICKERDKLFLVDAISILGGDDLPVDKWNIDICVTGSQKCLACPPGLALISVSERAWEVIKENKKKTYYFDLELCKDFLERKIETPFTPVLPLFYALDEALQIIREEGLERRIRRHKVCAKAMYSAIEAMKLKLFAEREFRSNTVVAVENPQNISDADIRRIMREKYGILIAGGMGKLHGTMFRIGVMGIVTEREVLTTVRCLEETLISLGYDLKPGTGVSAAIDIFEKEPY